MGREIKRVPLDFNWPLNKVWKGFINPNPYKKCPENDNNCFNGDSAAGAWLKGIIQLLMIAGADGACRDQTGARPYHVHPYLRRFELAPEESLPTPELGKLTEGLAGRSLADRPMGHDALDQFSAYKKIIVAAGLDPDTWGKCPVCKGSGQDPTTKAQYDAWEPTPPPEGEGWQVWETVSEGSPVSPVFRTAQELADWLVGQGHSRAAADSFVKIGWVPSAMSSPNGFLCGIECAAELNREQAEPK